MADIIISIKPEYARKILDSSKLFEFRKRKPRQAVIRAYIYASSPIKKIVGSFRVEGIIEGSPDEVWKKCGRYGGISKDDFFLYYGTNKIAYGFEISEVQQFNPPIDPAEVNPDFKPPQSFAYINSKITLLNWS